MEHAKYPAAYVVQWPTGPQTLCAEHARTLIAVGRYLGNSVSASPVTAPALCSSCQVESADQTDEAEQAHQADRAHQADERQRDRAPEYGSRKSQSY